MTIIEAIKKVMRDLGRPLTPREAYDEIVRRELYHFHAQDPVHVVLSQIRRHSGGIEIPSGARTKHFRLVGDNTFFPLDAPRRTGKRAPYETVRARRAKEDLGATLRALQTLRERYVTLLKRKIISELRRISPFAFESFAKELLRVYGFEEVQVTSVSRDGGIDGFGKLKVGLAHLNVAFQCKRWTRGKIQRTEIDRFRGAAQGDYDQGIFFATTTFSAGAIAASRKPGAILIVLVDSDLIVNLMIEKKFGVESESVVIPSYALDLALGQNDERERSHTLQRMSTSVKGSQAA